MVGDSMELGVIMRGHFFHNAWVNSRHRLKLGYVNVKLEVVLFLSDKVECT
jgi:hypothetical protein